MSFYYFRDSAKSYIITFSFIYLSGKIGSKRTVMRLSLHFLGILLLSLACLSAGAESQRKLTSYQKYISKYSDLAIQHQKKYRIPASITLAQGLLESGAGQSDLARRSNNHFGIKCHSDWRGGRVYHDDDLRGECFRKYKRVEDSYDDHSRFLAERSRYERLFKLNIKDYKGWAKGLQKCGYATDRAYANKLIKVIEDYELYRFDSGKGTKKTSTKKQKSSGVQLSSLSYPRFDLCIR